MYLWGPRPPFFFFIIMSPNFVSKTIYCNLEMWTNLVALSPCRICISKVMHSVSQVGLLFLRMIKCVFYKQKLKAFDKCCGNLAWRNLKGISLFNSVVKSWHRFSKQNTILSYRICLRASHVLSFVPVIYWLIVTFSSSEKSWNWISARYFFFLGVFAVRKLWYLFSFKYWCY